MWELYSKVSFASLHFSVLLPFAGLATGRSATECLYTNILYFHYLSALTREVVMQSYGFITYYNHFTRIATVQNSFFDYSLWYSRNDFRVSMSGLSLLFWGESFVKRHWFYWGSWSFYINVKAWSTIYRRAP